MSSALRIPYTAPFPTPSIYPPTATALPAAVAALAAFLLNPQPFHLPASTAVLSGAGLSVASGLADYRGPNGTYRRNAAYRPIYHHEFLHSHETRKRYWARSFLGWSSLHNAAPNAAHHALRDLGHMGLLSGVVTQNVDSFHPRAHPNLPSVELHGCLRDTVCTSCHERFSRDVFQRELARLNPVWAAALDEALAKGALDPADPEQRTSSIKGIRTNPDGDVDLPDAPYTTFRYPPCPRCLAEPPLKPAGIVAADTDGAWLPRSTAGILKPAVVLFGANIPNPVREAAEETIDSAGKLLILGTSLATYSALRLARRAKDRGMPIAIVNVGGVRGEEEFFEDVDPRQVGQQAVRTEIPTDELLPALAEHLRETLGAMEASVADTASRNSEVFKDMLS